MYHPQLRPFVLDRKMGHVTEKPNYNSVDVEELEVIDQLQSLVSC